MGTKTFLISCSIAFLCHSIANGQLACPKVDSSLFANVKAKSDDLLFQYSGKKVVFTYPRYNAPIIPTDYYTRGFGFFCKQELKMHDAHIPISFRLGSFDYCDRLEQKKLAQ